MKKPLYIISLLLIAVLSVMLAEHTAGKGIFMDNHSGTIELIPRTTLFGNPDRMKVRLSPNGKYISFIAPEKGVLNVWVSERELPQEAVPLTHDRKQGIRDYFWSYDNQHIIYIQDQDGNENWHLYCLNIETKAVKNLTPFKGVQARIIQASSNFPHEIIIALNKRKPEFHDLYHLDLATGELTLREENDKFASYFLDDQYNIRFAMRPLPDGGQEMLEKADSKWQTFAEIRGEDVITTFPLCFDKTGTILYMKDSRERNTAALFAIDLKGKHKTLIAQDSQADMSDVIIHPTEYKIQAFASTYERKTWQIIDPAIQKDIDYLKTVHKGDFEIADRSLNDEFWIVAYVNDQGPFQYYLYDRNARKAHYLFSSKKDLENLPLVPMHSTIIKTRDGLNMVSYYSLPLSADPQNKGRPTKPIPLVLFVHGGPTARDEWGYSSVHQWLANRGYAVLSVNYRGSTGFGKSFITAGYGQWAGKAHDDLIDAVRWACEQGIADPEKIAIMGGSYGGYATLLGLSLTADVFACGVDIVGPSNLITLLESVPPYWKPLLDMLKVRIGGDPNTAKGRAFLKSQSPLTYAHKINKPLLIGQGANDPRVKQKESEQIVKALEEKNIPVTYILYPDEGHGFTRPENKLSFFAVTEAFLARSLKGHIEPIGDAFKGSSIQIKVPGNLGLGPRFKASNDN